MQPLPSDPLDLAVLLFKQGEQRHVSGRNVEVVLPLSIDFQQASEAMDQASLLVAESEQTRKVEFSLPPTFFLSLAELLSNAGRRIQAPERFYLADSDYTAEAGAAEAPQGVRYYLSAVEAFRLIRQLADHEVLNGSRIELVFLAKEKLLITPDYSSDDLREIKGITELAKDFFETETHQDQKKTILKTVLIEIYGNRKKVCFGDLLASFEDIIERARNNYRLYVAEFSFEKVRAEVEKEKTEFTTRLNKVFSDIQNQLLAIPAALVLVGGQMQYAGKISIKNLLIWLGALVFSILINLLVRNQRNTLQAIKYEFDSQWKRMQEKHQAIAGEFSGAYNQLRQRYDHQRRLLWTIDGLVAGSFLFATVLLAKYSGLWFSGF